MVYFASYRLIGIPMAFKTYSTESGKIEEFEPIVPGEVKMYICGPTVYNLMHIGHARSYVFFDVLRRWLEHSGYEVTHVQNFSDVEESITRKGLKTGMTPEAVAELYIKEFLVDANELNMKPAHGYPTFSENVPAMIRIVQDLLDSGVAYESGGDVYFRTKGGSGFGRLSHVDIKESVVDDLDLPEGRENPFDFVLWRKSTKDGQPEWDSPWGKGRPGWHVGCYTMSSGYLGRCFDIHGGGLDLMYPHHESVLLLSEAHANKPICNYFVHNSYVTLGEEKMSKSKGNFVTVRKLSEKYGGRAVRLYVLKHHYRSIMDYDEMEIEKAAKELDELRTKLELLRTRGRAESSAPDTSRRIETFESEFADAMDNDLHTDDALHAFFGLINWSHGEAENLSKEDMETVLDVISKLSNVLGLFDDFQFY